MKRFFSMVLLFTALIIPLASYASYSDSEAFNVTKRIITETLDKIGCSDFRFAIFDYNVHQEGNLYAVYSDVKYVDKKGKNQRDYFALMFQETSDGYEPYFLSMGTTFYIVPKNLSIK